MPRSDIAYLRHILDAINRIEEYLQGVTEADFHNRYLIQDGVIRQIEIIGEAATLCTLFCDAISTGEPL